MATSNAFQTDPYASSRPRLSAMINFDDSTGVAPSGLVAAIVADPAAFFANMNTSPAPVYSMDNLIAAGIKRVLFNRPWGTKTPALELLNCPGHYPFTYPDANSAGNYLAVAPNNQVQSEAAFGNTTWTAALKAAFDTAGRLGGLYGAAIYQGPVNGASAVDNTTLDAHSSFAVDMGLDQVFDVQSAISCTNTAPPVIMGSNVMGYWEAGKLVYITSGTGSAATANADPIYHWDSIVGTASWTRQTDNGKRPGLKTSAVNGYPSILFDGTDDRMVLASPLALGSAFTIAMVVKPTATDSILLSNAASNRQVRFNTSIAGRISAFEGTLESASVGSSFTANTWYVVVLRYDGTNCRIYINGTQVASYAAGPAFGNNLTLDMLGAFGNGGASMFFNGELAALALINTSCTDNQTGLIQAYWAAKYGITVATTAFGAPVLPHKAFVAREFSSRARKVYRENFNFRTITELTDWDTNGKGILGVYDELAAAIAAAATTYTRTSIGTGQRARVMIPNNGPSAATRIAQMVTATGLGYDVDMDFGGFTNQEIMNAISQHSSAVPGLSAGVPAGPAAPLLGGLPEPLLRLG